LRRVGALALGLALTACAGSSHQAAQISTAPTPTVVASTTPLPGLAKSDWLEYHHDAGRTGVGPATPVIGKPSVAWTDSLDGAVYASPLIVAGHVIVATENDTVYSLDVAGGDVLWTAHLGDPVDASTLPCGDISPVSGITSTPVADPAAGSLYVVAFLRGFQHVLFTLSLKDGSVISQRTVDPPNSNPRVQQQRAALARGSGFVYVAFGGLFGDCGDYHGWLVGVPVGGGGLNVYETPARRSGIWAASGPTVAPDGSVYVVTGNGAPTSTFDYSDSVIQLSSTLAVVSYFAPSNWQLLTSGDTDLGSNGAALIGDGLVFAVGKSGVAYLLKAGSLGGIGGELSSMHLCDAAFGGTAWSGQTIFVPCTDGLFAVTVSGQTLSTAWQARDAALGSPIVAAGAAWAIDPNKNNLFALDAHSGAILFSTNLDTTEPFSTPAATEGYVVAGAGTKVVAIATG